MNIERKILRLNESLIELDDHVRTLEETVSGEIYELRMSLRRLETNEAYHARACALARGVGRTLFVLTHVARGRLIGRLRLSFWAQAAAILVTGRKSTSHAQIAPLGDTGKRCKP